jgi:hypothetical protein
MIKKRVMAKLLFLINFLSMKVIGKMIKLMEKEYFFTAIEIDIKENSLMD